MKKYLGIFSAVFALAAISFSCQKAEITDPNAPGTEQTYNKVDVVLTATLESRIGTKVTLDFPNLAWEDQDQIAVFDGKNTAPNVFTYQAPVVEDENTEETNPEEVTPAAVAVKSSVVRPSFSGSIAESAEEFYAVYPYNANATLADGKITTTIPHEQVVPAGGNVDKSALLCVAKTTSDALAFKNVLGLVKVTVPAGMTGITSISVEGANDEDVLAGTGAITVSDAPSFVATDAKNRVTLTHAKGGFPKGDYYIAVAPVPFANGFSVSFTKANGETQTKSTEKSNEVVRNSGLNVGDKLTEITWEYLITTKDQLVEWNNNYESWTKNDVVKLGADINLDGVNWTPHDFYGTFDGQNHKIYNFNCVVTEAKLATYAGFFNRILGTSSIKNFVLGSSDGENYDNQSIIKIENNESFDTWRYAGVVGKAEGSSTIENVKNFASVEVGSADNGKTRVAGICGCWASTGNVKGSFNYGDVEIKANAYKTSKESCLAGILGIIDVATTSVVDSCYNYGTIRLSGKQAKIIAGIVGFVVKGTTIKKCQNYGLIELTASVGGTTIAGICALGNDKVKLESCENHGKIINNYKSQGAYVGGIMGYLKGASKSEIIGCSNYGTINCTSTYAYAGGIISTKEGAGALTISNCKSATETVGGNKMGNITVNASQNSYVGGVIAWIKDCTVNISNSDFDSSIAFTSTAEADAGGIVGIVGYKSGKNFISSDVTISECNKNQSSQASITVSGVNTYVSGVYGRGYVASKTVVTNTCNKAKVEATGKVNLAVGGVVAYAERGTFTVTGCSNSGIIDAKRTLADEGPGMFGGIVGYVANATEIKTCSNTGNISYNAFDDDKYYAMGGIAGRGPALTIEDCVNTGNLTANYKTTNQLANVGGIIGSAHGGCTIKNNVNGAKDNPLLGAIVSTNSASKTAYAGGIVGGDNEGITDAATTNVITGNKNYGTVTAAANGVTLTTSGAGGIIGTLKRIPTTFSDNTNYGNVSASGATTNAAGAICGYMESTKAAISSIAYTGLTVNGVAKADASDLDLWLCGSSKGGEVTATYVDAIQ